MKKIPVFSSVEEEVRGMMSLIEESVTKEEMPHFYRPRKNTGPECGADGFIERLVSTKLSLVEGWQRAQLLK